MIGIRIRAALLALCGVAVYWNALSAPFILDDRTSILTNSSIETLALPGPLLTPPDTPVARRPLVNLSFAVTYAVAERSVRWYHAGNLLIHILAALALFGIVRRTLLLPPLDTTFRDAATPIAWVCALVWLLHPLNSEVVDYVTQRSTGLLGLFYLLTLYGAIRSATARAGHKWQAVTVICCAAGMVCKETMVTAPLMVALFDRVFLSDSWTALARRRGPMYGGLAASWLLLAMVMQSSERTSAGFGASAQGLDPVSAWTYLLNQARVIPQYLFLSIWPRELVADYGATSPIAFATVAVRGALVALAAVAVTVALFRWPRAAFPGVWFFVTLAPTSSIVPIATEVAAERRMYLPLAALVVLAVTSAYVLARRQRVSGLPLRAACAVVLALLAVGTVMRNREYADPLRLAETVVERWPSGRSLVHLGALYEEHGDKDGALREFRRAAAVFPPGHYALGVALAGRRRPDEALTSLRQYISLAPHHVAVPAARDLIGRILVDRGDIEGGGREFEAILADNPGDVRAMVTLAEVRMRQQRFDEAAALFEQAYRRDGSVRQSGAVMARFGTALAASRKMQEAERVFAEGAAVSPRDAGLQKLWGRSLVDLGRFVEAGEHFRRAYALAPDDPEARELAAAADQRTAASGSAAVDTARNAARR
jgi:Flp pilus assembly protein TadD